MKFSMLQESDFTHARNNVNKKYAGVRRHFTQGVRRNMIVAKIHTLLILVDARNQISSVIEVYLQFLKISRWSIA